MPLGFGHHLPKDTSLVAEERGREPFIATGRGGAGNIIRSTSRSRDRSVEPISSSAFAAAQTPPHLIHGGRGGVGNVRSPSRDPQDRQKLEEAQAREDKIQEEYRQQDKKLPHSTGRGGAGNIAENELERGRGRDGPGRVASILFRSLSRSRSREPSAGGIDPPDRSLSHARASEGSRLAQVDETPRSSEEESSDANESCDQPSNRLHMPE